MRAIAEARSHGDMSENSEYKYAKEQERTLNRRQADLERDLASVQTTNFRNQTVADTVVAGCAITLRNLADGTEEQIYLLGVFDGDPDRKYFSYESPLGKILMGHKAGDQLQMPAGYDAVIVAVEALPEAILQELDPVEE